DIEKRFGLVLFSFFEGKRITANGGLYLSWLAHAQPKSSPSASTSIISRGRRHSSAQSFGSASRCLCLHFSGSSGADFPATIASPPAAACRALTLYSKKSAPPAT